MSPHDVIGDPNRIPNRRSEADSHERTNERTDGESGNGCLSGNGSRRTRACPDSQSISLGDLLVDDGKPRRLPTTAEAEVMARLLRDRNLAGDGIGEGHQVLSDVVDEWLDDLGANYGKRWPVIRSGERDPIPWIVRLSILLRDDFHCRRCSYAGDLSMRDNLELDHCIPWSAGGPDDSDNLRTLCRWCNQTRSNYIDDSHETNLRPTTWWCLECWPEGDDYRFRRIWRDGTDPNKAPRVDPDEPMELVWCAHCSMYSMSSRFFVGRAGRELAALCAPQEVA